jgi:hypothetical protein
MLANAAQNFGGCGRADIAADRCTNKHGAFVRHTLKFNLSYTVKRFSLLNDHLKNESYYFARTSAQQPIRHGKCNKIP